MNIYTVWIGLRNCSFGLILWHKCLLDCLGDNVLSL